MGIRPVNKGVQGIRVLVAKDGKADKYTRLIGMRTNNPAKEPQDLTLGSPDATKVGSREVCAKGSRREGFNQR